MTLVSASEFTVIVRDPEDPSITYTAWDMIAGMWNLGFGHGQIVPREDLQAGTVKYNLDIRNQLAERLAKLFGYPGVLLFGAGSEATDTAVRIAQTLTGRTKTLALKEGYHGCTGYAALVGRDLNRRALPKNLQALFDGGTIGYWACADVIDEEQMEQELNRIPWDEIGIFIFEPVQGSAGGWRLNPLAYEAIVARCHQHGVLVVADEIMTGLGRCGYLALSQTYSTPPDMILLGKTLGHEKPISAVLVSEGIVKNWRRLEKLGFNGTTTAGNLQGCLVAMEVLNRVTVPGFLERMREKSTHLEGNFRTIFTGSPGVKGVRPYGLFFTLVCDTPQLVVDSYWELLRRDGFAVDTSGQKLRFCPPFEMPLEVIEKAFAATAHRLRQLSEDR